MPAKWDRQLMEFLRKAGEELKQTGDELKSEAQRLLDEVRDPERRTKVKERLQGLRTWAEKTGKDAAELIETAVRRAEEALAYRPPPAPPPEEELRAPPGTPVRDEAPARAAAPTPRASKTLGRKRASKPKTGGPAPARKKTVGKKGPPSA